MQIQKWSNVPNLFNIDYKQSPDSILAILIQENISE